MPVFNRAEFLAKWDQENPEIAIPDEPRIENDRDWILSEEEE